MMNPKVIEEILNNRNVFGPSIKDKTGEKKDVEANSTWEACYEDVEANGTEVLEDWEQHFHPNDLADNKKELRRRHGKQRYYCQHPDCTFSAVSGGLPGFCSFHGGFH